MKANMTTKPSNNPVPKTPKPKGLATRQKPKMKTEEYQPSKVIPVEVTRGATHKEQAKAFANRIASPELAAYRVIGMLQPKCLADEVDAAGMLVCLRDKAAAVNIGDLSHAEAMLINQAEALQSIFVRLMERGTEQTLMPNIEGFMRLALRAQSQCRATLETLAAIKNPPIVYARQANFANGPQQVNNAQQVNNGVPAQAREKQIEQTQLSEVSNELLPDTRASQDESRVNQTVEAVGTLDRATDGRGKGALCHAGIQGRHAVNDAKSTAPIERAKGVRGGSSVTSSH